MKKTEKKAAKPAKKSAKKKNAKNGGGFDFNSKQLQKEFNKRMKVVVQEVKKDTEKAIKVLMKEAKQKIHAGSEFVRHDVLKSLVSQYEHVAEKVEHAIGIDHAEAPPAPDSKAAAPAARRRAPATRQAPVAGSDATRPAATTRNRKTAKPMATANAGGSQAA
jgi:hypothetical protein